VVALAIIGQHPNITQSALGRQMGINRASSMALSMSLEAAGFLSRVAKSGRKQTGLTLTALGQERLLEACAIEDDIRSTLFGWMDADALDSFIGALQRITNIIRQSVA
jgi:DNA-binding MarR family transcriptional regulator